MLRDRVLAVYAVVMGMVARDKPSSIAPAPWPTVPSPDPIAEIARQFAINLRDTIESQSIRSISARTGVSHVTILKILAGQVWPDLITIAKLELGLDAYLWPRKAESD